MRTVNPVFDPADYAQSQTAIAEKTGLTKQRVGQIETNAIRKLWRSQVNLRAYQIGGNRVTTRNATNP